MNDLIVVEKIAQWQRLPTQAATPPRDRKRRSEGNGWLLCNAVVCGAHYYAESAATDHRFAAETRGWHFT